jgi:NAD(P)-dependent dehydrogenase (short-subunit alcohol dehydrogenase family)
VDVRSAVVVGGGSGIGAAVAAALAGSGYLVTVADLDAAAASLVADGLGEPHLGAQADVTSEASVSALLEAVVAREGRLDVVVNCAGVSTIGLVTDLAVEEFRRVVDVDLTGGFVVLKHAGRLVRDGGSIVTITSLNARQPAAGLGAYCAAKAGLAMLVQVTALELGERGVRVNAISPGLVETPLTAPALEIPGILDDYLENTPLGRAGSPSDVAALVRFVCSDEAAWLTGSVLDLDGGAHLQRYPDLLGHIRKAFG